MGEPGTGSDATPRGIRFERVVFFSDAVFAIAATLLFIDLRPPVAPAAGYEAALTAFLSRPAPFIAIAIGFFVVGSYWVSHRGIFALLRTTDGPIVWANLLFLFWIAIQPFFTAALAEHDPTVTSVVAYASCQVLAGLSQLGLWAAALRDRDLLTPAATPRRIRYVTIQLIRAPLAFALSIPIAVALGPTTATLSWGLIIVVAVVIHRAFGDLTTIHAAAQSGSSVQGPTPVQGPTLVRRADGRGR